MTAILVSLLLGIAGSLVSSNAFPGLDACGSSCDLQLLSQVLFLGTSNDGGYGIQIEALSFVLVAAVIGALTLAKTEKKA